MGVSAKLKQFFSHSKLKQVIRNINSAKNRRERLKKQIEQDDDFRGFVDLVLEEMGYLQNGKFAA